MKNRFVRTLALVVAASTLAVSTASAAPDAEAIKDKQEQAEAEVDSLKNQIAAVVTEINDLEEQLIAKGEEIATATEELTEAEEQEKEQYEAMKLRIKYMYEAGNTTIFEKIAEAGSISELLNQAEYVQNVHTYDRTQLEEYVATKEKIAELKVTLEEEQKALEASQDEFEAKKAELDQTLEAKKDEVEDLQAEYQAALEQIEKERQEEEARRQQAANNTPSYTPISGNNGNSGNSGSGNSNSSGSNGGYTSPGNTSTAQAIVNAAYSQLGTPYVWGGTSPNVGLDCSGLTQYCHRVAGISIPRTSGPQGSGGAYVSSPQPGDIVCYSGHVGIYIGGGQMIHAPQPGDVVRIQAVYGNPWYRRYW